MQDADIYSHMLNNACAQLVEMYKRDTTARNLLEQSRPSVGYHVEQVYALYGNPEQYVQAQLVAVAELKVAKAAMPPQQAELLDGYSKQLDATAEISERELAYGEELGRGAFGTVLRAGWKEAQVAVKVLAKMGKTASKHFIQEVALMLKFEHAGIVQVHGWTKKEASLGLVVELMTDGSLHDQHHVGLDMLKTELTLPLKVSIARQVTSALTYLHDECDMAHRDIKPHNVLLGFAEDKASVKAKVCDFGFVKVRNSVCSSTASQATAIFVGTPSYAAPEDFEEKVEDDDVAGWKKCDVYAMGVLLWELFEEEVPYWGHSATAIKKMVIAGETLEPSNVPAAYRPILTSMWQLNPSARPRMADVEAAFNTQEPVSKPIKKSMVVQHKQQQRHESEGPQTTADRGGVEPPGYRPHDDDPVNSPVPKPDEQLDPKPDEQLDPKAVDPPAADSSCWSTVCRMS